MIELAQPLGTAPRVAKSSALARGLIAAWYAHPAGYIDGLGNNVILPASTRPQLVPGRRGQSLAYTHEIGYGLVGGARTRVPTSAITVAMWMRFASIPYSYAPVITRAAGAGTDWEIGADAATKKLYYGYNGGAIFVSSSVVADTDWHLWVMTIDPAGNGAWYTDGAANGTGSGKSLRTATGNIYLGTRSDGASANHTIGSVAIWDRALSHAEVLQYRRDEWQVYARRQKRIYVSVSGGGSIYAVDLSEAASAADALASVALRIGAMAEAASAADLVANALQATRAIAEAATASEAAAGTLVAPRSVAEAATASDSISTGGVTSNSIAEAAAAADSITSSAVLVGAMAEAASAADVVAALKVMQAAVSEPATASDLAAGLLIASAAIAEAAAASESASTGPQYAVSQAEAASAADALTAAAQLVGAVAEAATAGAAFSTAATLVALITETATAADAPSAGATTYGVSLTELAAAVETLTAAIVSGGPEVYAAISTLRRQMFGPSSATRPAQRATGRWPAQ